MVDEAMRSEAGEDEVDACGNGCEQCWLGCPSMLNRGGQSVDARNEDHELDLPMLRWWV